MVKIGPVTTEILLIWTNVARTNVAWTNVTMTAWIWSSFVKIRWITAEIFLIWTNVARTNVAWTNVTVTVKSVQNGLRNLPLKFGQNRVSNSWDIAEIEFVWVGGGWGGVCTVIFMSNLQLQLGWGYVVVELGFWQLILTLS